jgi:hypothetical protein
VSGEVLFDGWCGEPIAWARVGEPVIGHERTEHGRVAVTEYLTPAEAVRKYGPITEVVLGPKGGFESVTYGAKKFMSSFVDPRRTGMYDDSVVVVHDPTKENYECPVCGAAPGEQCVNKKQHPCATHSKRRHGRGTWDIEREERAARKAREDRETAEQWRRDMAKPPTIGEVLEQGLPEFAGRLTVRQSCVNRTVRPPRRAVSKCSWHATNTMAFGTRYAASRPLRACLAGFAAPRAGAGPRTRRGCACARTNRGSDVTTAATESRNGLETSETRHRSDWCRA